MTTLIKRTLTGLLFSTLMVLAVLWNEVTYFAFFALVIVLATIEYYLICRKIHGRPLMAWQISLSLLLFIGSFFYFKKVIPISATGIIIPIMFFVFITELYRRKRRALMNLSLTFIPVIHVGVPLSLLNGLAFYENVYDYRLVLGITILIWLNDTMAYVIGTLIGKNRIMPKVSPKKSWEGFFGGAIAVGIVVIILGDYWTVISIVNWAVVAAFIVVFGLLGDMVESLIKRNAGMKDSGDILPGHGGVLDRFDSLLFVVPFVFGYLYLIS